MTTNIELDALKPGNLFFLMGAFNVWFPAESQFKTLKTRTLLMIECVMIERDPDISYVKFLCSDDLKQYFVHIRLKTLQYAWKLGIITT